jgi:hypothetical protein
MKYRLDVKRDVDEDYCGGYMLNLPFGFRFYDDLVHVRGFDTLREVRQAAREDVIPCDCAECTAAKKASAADSISTQKGA